MMNQLDIASFAATKTPARSTTKAEAMKAATEFETVYIADALKLMVQDINPDPAGGGSDNASQSWREMLMEEYAKSITARGGIGLAAPMARELLNIQEAKSAP